ncbi:MAG TPA: hypothetical protein VF607_12495 [Verrucomicrobiae bacterium]
MKTSSAFWARVSYWLLFIIAPTVAAFYWLGLSVASVGVFVVLALIGEHGFLYWKRLLGAE